MPAAAPDDLSQRDLSGLRIEQMNPAERAEMQKRYEAFIRSFNRAAAPSPKADGGAAAPRRWVPPRAR